MIAVQFKKRKKYIVTRNIAQLILPFPDNDDNNNDYNDNRDCQTNCNCQF